MARHAVVTFLGSEKELLGVDPDFRELARLSYAVPGFGSYGVSCSGHFEADCGYGKFYPSPWGSMGFATIPQIPHVTELLKRIHQEVGKDPNARMGINNWTTYPLNFPKYTSGMDLDAYSVWKNKSGQNVVIVDIGVGDNGCLKSVPDHCCAPIKREGNDEAYKKSEQRCTEIKAFWGSLERMMKQFCDEHGFSKLDFRKEEFE